MPQRIETNSEPFCWLGQPVKLDKLTPRVALGEVSAQQIAAGI
ncbi:MAG TPA: hypothetical protein VIE66_03560 [Methylocella sp.]|jgi:hypothetical protein